MTKRKGETLDRYTGSVRTSCKPNKFKARFKNFTYAFAASKVRECSGSSFAAVRNTGRYLGVARVARGWRGGGAEATFCLRELSLSRAWD